METNSAARPLSRAERHGGTVARHDSHSREERATVKAGLTAHSRDLFDCRDLHACVNALGRLAGIG
jgi:hypothetical protein